MSKETTNNMTQIAIIVLLYLMTLGAIGCVAWAIVEYAAINTLGMMFVISASLLLGYILAVKTYGSK